MEALKSPTGIHGLDEITFGGLPRERATLVCGGPGSGKTLLAMEFIVHGATKFKEPGVFVAFEETEKELAQNFRSLGYDIDKLAREGKIVIDHIHVDPSEIEETGDFDLEGLFIRLQNAIDSVGAKRIALDTLEVLFGGFPNATILRAELARLFRWLKDKGLTVIVAGEKGSGDSLTRFGIEEYVTDCVLVLDHRVNEQVSIRRLRILKYRGSVHGTNEYPYLIDEDGISLLPATTLAMQNSASKERVSTGIEGLDTMLENKGFYRGSSILMTGTAGTGKTTFAAHIISAACDRGERCLLFSFEESPSQIIRNMKTVGIQLEKYLKNGTLQFFSDRPSMYGLEMHLVTVFKRIRDFRPSFVAIDPVTSLTQMGSSPEVLSMLTRLVDFLKAKGITSIFTSLTSAGVSEQDSMVGISSLMDTWILLRSQDTGGMRDHGVYVLKSRGMAHSNGIRQFRFTSRGIILQ